MDKVSKTYAVQRMERAGMVVSAFGDMIYADYQCSHCGGVAKIGELTVQDGHVGILALEKIIKDYENRH